MMRSEGRVGRVMMGREEREEEGRIEGRNGFGNRNRTNRQRTKGGGEVEGD
jgi:hypothetical protein